MNNKSVKSLYASKKCQYVKQERCSMTQLKTGITRATSMFFQKAVLHYRSKHYSHIYKHLSELFPEARESDIQHNLCTEFILIFTAV